MRYVSALHKPANGLQHYLAYKIWHWVYATKREGGKTGVGWSRDREKGLKHLPRCRAEIVSIKMEDIRDYGDLLTAGS